MFKKVNDSVMRWRVEFRVEGRKRFEVKVRIENPLQLCYVGDFCWTPDWRSEDWRNKRR